MILEPQARGGDAGHKEVLVELASLAGNLIVQCLPQSRPEFF